MFYWTSFVAVFSALVLQHTEADFSCDGRTSGYYADVERGCQIYHMCDGLGRQFSYTCPNATLFQQRMLICDHWYMVNCSKSEEDYSANLLIGQREKPFIGDESTNTFHRTPRPDLLSQPTASEYNIIYRTGRAHGGNNYNLVGVESDSDHAPTSTDEPVYFLPSHWSTELSQPPQTPEQSTENPQVSPKYSRKAINRIKFKATTDNPVNFKSNFTATTPVFPLSVEPTTIPPDKLGVLPPIPYKIINNRHDENVEHVNFQSNFEATTPVFPLYVDPTTVAPESLGISPPEYREPPLKINFGSNFQATTPDYPHSVESTSIDPGNLGVLPPRDGEDFFIEETALPPINLELLPPNIDFLQSRNDTESENSTPQPPSKFYQPPKFEPDYPKITNKLPTVKPIDPKVWENIRKKLFIPDYVFPVESAVRPSYESGLNSYQVPPMMGDK